MNDTVSKSEGGFHHTVAVNKAYQAGKKRREEDMRDPHNDGSPRKDGYGSMTKEEREAYKKGFRGD